MKLTIIGAGPGGYSAAFAAAKAGVDVTLVERAKLGGTCLHTGCIPTKTLRSSADVLEMSGRLAEFGITGECTLKADMPAIVNRKRKVTATLQTGLEKTCAQLKVRVVYGKAELVSAKLVRVTTAEGMEEVESDNVIIATGSSPLELPALPVDHARVLSSDDALELQAVPASLIIVGGGVIGCELAFIYRAFGSKVTVVEGQNRVLPLPSVDEEISRLLQREMKKKGIAVELARTVTATTPTGTGVSVEIGASPFVEVANPPAPRTLEADAVCVTVGRVPHTDGLGSTPPGSRSTPEAGSKPTTFWKPQRRACTPSATSSGRAASCWRTWPSPKPTPPCTISCIPKTGRRSATMLCPPPSSPPRKSGMWGSPKRKPSNRGSP